MKHKLFKACCSSFCLCNIPISRSIKIINQVFFLFHQQHKVVKKLTEKSRECHNQKPSQHLMSSFLCCQSWSIANHILTAEIESKNNVVRCAVWLHELKRIKFIHWKQTIYCHLEFSAFFALSKQIPFVYSAVCGWAEKQVAHEHFGLKSFSHHIGKIEFLRSLWAHFPSYYIDSHINFCINSGRAACNIMSLELKETSTLYKGKFKKMCQIQNMKVTVSHYSCILPWFHLL